MGHGGGAQLLGRRIRAAAVGQEHREQGVALPFRVVQPAELEARQALDLLLEAGFQRGQALDQGVQLAELGHQHRRGKLVHAEVLPDDRALAHLHAHAQGQVPLVVVAEGPLVQPGVVGDHHAPVAGVDGLEDVEGVGAQLPDRAEAAAVVGAAEGLGRVLQEQQVVLLGDGSQAVQVAGIADHVHRQDGPRVRGDARFHVGRVQGQAVVHLGQHGNRVVEDDRGHGSDEGVAGNDDLVAGPQPRRRHGRDQGGGSGGNGQRVLDPELPLHLLLQGFHPVLEGWILGIPVAEKVARLDQVKELFFLFLPDPIVSGSGHRHLRFRAYGEVYPRTSQPSRRI